MVMQHNCSYDELVDIHKLVPHPQNPNKHPDNQIERLAKIIDYQGQRSPVVVCKETGFIVVGHGRLEAMKKLGWDKVAVNYQTFKDEAQRYAHMTADNAIAEWAALDLAQINQDMLDLGPELDLELLGIEDFVLEPIEKLDPGLVDEDDVPEVSEPITKRGDVWILGDHRVMCGDSTMINDVEKLMAGEKADMVFTDPPYGMFLDTNYTSMGSKMGKNKDFKPVAGDNEDFKPELIQTLFTAFSDAKEMFLWGADYYAELIPDRNAGSWVIWDKSVTESMDRGFGSAWESCWSKQRHKRTFCRLLWRGLYGKKDDMKTRAHPTQKPTHLAEWFFEQWCKGLSLCADLYLGSGSTLIACEKTNRKCYGMELDEHYCDVIVNRWQNYTGKKAVLESNGKTYDELKDSNVG